jgi:hypothetical protein
MKRPKPKCVVCQHHTPRVCTRCACQATPALRKVLEQAADKPDPRQASLPFGELEQLDLGIHAVWVEPS